MSKIAFYVQARADGGRRFGIEVDGETEFGRYEEGAPDSDPRLLWYVDIRCNGATLPRDAEGARSWLLRHAMYFTRELHALSKELRAGLDADIMPLLRPLVGAPDGAEITIACSSLHSPVSRDYGRNLADIANRFVELIESLKPAELAA